MKHLALVLALLATILAEAQDCGALKALEQAKRLHTTLQVDSGRSYGLQLICNPMPPRCEHQGCMGHHTEVAPREALTEVDTTALADLQALLACIMAEWRKQQPPAAEP
ncbi:MAG: hypothetical protein IPJ76_00220 [Flavobacteriales bacterium]|nr:MAG: hypothetical protein IPJ76_00220 [Flavobacteriales bacterium]